MTEFLRGYLADPREFPGAIERARAALALFRIDPQSALAGKTLAELLKFIRESDDATPDYLGILRGLEEMGERARPICRSFSPASLPESHPDVERARALFEKLCRLPPAR